MVTSPEETVVPRGELGRLPEPTAAASSAAASSSSSLSQNPLRDEVRREDASLFFTSNKKCELTFLLST